ncbi:hypothetical protein YC2023_013024 [Brassica napus]
MRTSDRPSKNINRVIFGQLRSGLRAALTVCGNRALNLAPEGNVSYSTHGWRRVWSFNLLGFSLLHHLLSLSITLLGFVLIGPPGRRGRRREVCFGRREVCSESKSKARGLFRIEIEGPSHRMEVTKLHSLHSTRTHRNKALFPTTIYALVAFFSVRGHQRLPPLILLFDFCSALPSFGHLSICVILWGKLRRGLSSSAPGDVDPRSGVLRCEQRQRRVTVMGGLSPPGLVVWLSEELLFAVEWSD